MVAFVFFFWFLAPILYCESTATPNYFRVIYLGIIDKNVFFSKFLPMSADLAFDNTGNLYDASQVIRNGVFDPTAYAAYSPPFATITFVLGYAVSFAATTAVVVHTFRTWTCDTQELDS